MGYTGADLAALCRLAAAAAVRRQVRPTRFLFLVNLQLCLVRQLQTQQGEVEVKAADLRVAAADFSQALSK
jgi:SpoVK/Ycf46/Vps4 family AAA+-type ATPase